jgi:hypothetical protein
VVRNLSDDARRDIDSFLMESKEDYIGLWHIIDRARDRETELPNVEAEVLGVIRGLLALGLQAGHLTRDGGFAPWPDQRPDAVTGRIHAEWQALGEDPSIDDICWFHLPRPPG